MKPKLSEEMVALAKQFFVANCASQSRVFRVHDETEFFQNMAQLSLDAAIVFEKTLRLQEQVATTGTLEAMLSAP